MQLLQRRRDASPIEAEWSSPIVELDDQESRIVNMQHQMDAANQVALSMLSGTLSRFLTVMHSSCIPRSHSHSLSHFLTVCLTLSLPPHTFLIT